MSDFPVRWTMGILVTLVAVAAVTTIMNNGTTESTTREPTTRSDDETSLTTDRLSKITAEGYSCLGPRYGVEIDREEARKLFAHMDDSSMEAIAFAGIWLVDLTGDCHDHADMLERAIIEDGEDLKTHLNRSRRPSGTPPRERLNQTAQRQHCLAAI